VRKVLGFNHKSLSLFWKDYFALIIKCRGVQKTSIHTNIQKNRINIQILASFLIENAY
jgi:hypothetical protein